MNAHQSVDTLRQIPLSQLILSPRNARKTNPAALAELAASIAAHGLLQNLVVADEPDDGPSTGRHEVVAGGRRLRAMQMLVKQGRLDADHLVPCTLRQGLDAEEASIAENSAREAMHPADEFEAFKRLVDAGIATEDIAARFGVTPLVVQRRLKLANVSPKMIQIYRAGEASLEQLMALAISYLSLVPKTMAIAAVTEACGKKAAAPLASMKKADLAANAEQLLAGTGWLPKILRGPKKAAPKPTATNKPARPPVRYRDENGNTWTGRGKRPGWVEQALKDGKTLDELLAS